MEYENLIKECFDIFSIQPTGKNNIMKTKILKKFYEESLRVKPLVLNRIKFS